MNLLHALHSNRAPRVVMTLRGQDPIPEWATHVVRADGGRVTVGRRHQMAVEHAQHQPKQKPATKQEVGRGKPVVEINGLNIGYHERKVLTDISWTIREGERWHLKGPNGQ
jgi:ATPase subunit of ABC transporter with duplicated ATPase domains